MLIERLADQGVVTPGNRRFVEAYELPRIERIHALVRRHSPAPQSLRILNIGLLDGLVPLALLLLDPDLTITSTERPDAGLAQATGPPALQATGRHSSTRLDLTADTHDLRGFDWVICGEVLEHLSSPSLPRAMRNLAHAAERIVVTTPNLHALRYRLRHLVGIDFQQDPISYARMGLGHVSLLSARLLVDLAADAGLAVTDLEFHWWTSNAQGSKHRVLASLARPVQSLADDIVATFRRDARVQPSAVFGAEYVPVRTGLAAARRAAAAGDSQHTNPYR